MTSPNQSNDLPDISEGFAKNNIRELSRKATAKDDTVGAARTRLDLS